MRNDFGNRPYVERYSNSSKSSGSKKQGTKDKLDESLGMRDGKESTKTQSYKSRRDESKGAE